MFNPPTDTTIIEGGADRFPAHSDVRRNGDNSGAGGTGVGGTGVGGRAVGKQDDVDIYRAATEEFSAVAGIVNAAHGRLVDLTVLTMDEQHHVGPGLYTCGQYVAWQAGVSRTTANRICRLAKRHQELPETLAKLRIGKISLEQADVIAQLCPAEYEECASEVALSASVAQLRLIVGCYSNKKDPKPPPPNSLSISRDETGANIRARIGLDDADLFEKALQAMRDDLFNQHKLDKEAAAKRAKKAKNSNSDGPNPGGDGSGAGHGSSAGDGNGAGGSEDPALGAKKAPSRIDALRSLCETALQAGEAAHPSSERYLVNYHIHATASGELCLTNQHGQPLPKEQRQRILCDFNFESVLHNHTGEPLSIGRKTRSISPKLRRAILFRDNHCCTVPGCDTTVGLEIHHIVHWEDGGTTDLENLSTLCGTHHRLHHQGLLDITANPLRFSTPSGTDLSNINPPKPISKHNCAPSIAKLRKKLKARTINRDFAYKEPVASTPTGERLDRRAIHLNRSEPPAVTPPAPTPMRT